ncbi:MAG: hypothetical protein ACJAQT_004881 [Akkermansiaceae bacterium]|jgi:hypothetical protein
MILISRDRTEDDALNWATTFAQPWPILHKEDTDHDILYTPFKITGVPTYILVDQTGKEVARGLGAALAAAKKG